MNRLNQKKKEDIKWNEKIPTNYVGLNVTPLYIIGKILCYVIIHEEILHFELLIVTNRSMA